MQIFCIRTHSSATEMRCCECSIYGDFGGCLSLRREQGRLQIYYQISHTGGDRQCELSRWLTQLSWDVRGWDLPLNCGGFCHHISIIIPLNKANRRNRLSWRQSNMWIALVVISWSGDKPPKKVGFRPHCAHICLISWILNDMADGRTTCQASQEL